MRAAKRHRVCVKPCFQGFNLIYSRGTELSDATLSNEAVHQRGKHPLAMDVYLLSTVQQAVQLTWFAFMVLHDTPPKPSHRVLAAEPRVFVSFSFCSLRENHLLKHLQLFGLFTLLFFTFLPTVAIELTENQCQSVCVCQPLCQRVHCQLLPFSQQGAIPLPSGGWPTKRPLGGAANVPATTVEHAVQFDQFDSWSFMIPTPQTFFFCRRQLRR